MSKNGYNTEFRTYDYRNQDGFPSVAFSCADPEDYQPSIEHGNWFNRHKKAIATVALSLMILAAATFATQCGNDAKNFAADPNEAKSGQESD
ncbi:MAG: hypothetical protein LBC95_02735 [Candidatus Nomurabacteria bacterium]|jgi:hypothetical protein|nr:hypothetical protein [Candidatus Nomurabacteria bacterium]